MTVRNLIDLRLPAQTLPVRTLPVQTLPVQTLPVRTWPVRSLGSALLGFFLVSVILNPPVAAQTWSLHGPQSRHSHSAVFDPATAKMIIFGGQATSAGFDLNDVWLGQTGADQNDSFTQLQPTGTLPAGRYGHVAAYDSSNTRMMIFGGAEGHPGPCANDVWVLQSANGQGTEAWSNSKLSGVAPAARIYAGGAYDPNSNDLIVFGGNDCSTGYFNDVWTLSNANGVGGTSAWTQLHPSGTAPPARQSGSAVYDSTSNVLTLFGGDAGGSTLFNDVWILTHANGRGGTPAWSELSPTGTAPAARTGQSAVYDSANNRMLVTGGVIGGATLTDTWALTSANGQGGTSSWVQVKLQGTAPSVAYHSAVYDSAANNIYVFAGSSSANKLGDNDHAFTLINANGLGATGKWFLGGPPVRYGHSAFYDSASNGLFVFGGQHATTNLNFNDYWQASSVTGNKNLQWISVVSTGKKPAARFGHAGSYDSSTNRMMIFGGATGFPSPCANDYYVLKNANNTGAGPSWVTVTPTGTAPAARLRSASVYVSGANKLVLFGGNNCSTAYFNDVWILSGANDFSGTPAWSQLTTSGTRPSARQSSSAVYDAVTNTLIVYGGDAGKTPSGQIWNLSNATGSSGTSTWTQLKPSNAGPVARSGHAATYDSTTNVMTIYGGFDGTKILSDAWTLSNANGTGGSAVWTQLPANQPRRYHSSNYDPLANEMITYGGTTATQPINPVSDIYTLTNANGLP